MSLSALGCGQPVDTTGAAFTPSSLSGLKAWYDAQNSGSVTQSGGAVSQWNDLSTSAVNVVQATGSKQPIYSATSFNSRPGITFTGSSSQVLSASALPFASFSDFTAFIIFNCTLSSTLYKTLYALGASGDELDLATRNNLSADIGIIFLNGAATTKEADTSSISVAVNTNHYVCFKRDTSDVASFRVDGANDATATTLTNHPITIGTSLTFIGGDNTTEFFTGTIGEVIVYNRLLNGTEIGQVETYIKSRWGL